MHKIMLSKWIICCANIFRQILFFAFCFFSLLSSCFNGTSVFKFTSPLIVLGHLLFIICLKGIETLAVIFCCRICRKILSILICENIRCRCCLHLRFFLFYFHSRNLSVTFRFLWLRSYSISPRIFFSFIVLFRFFNGSFLI